MERERVALLRHEPRASSAYGARVWAGRPIAALAAEMRPNGGRVFVRAPGAVLAAAMLDRKSVV